MSRPDEPDDSPTFVTPGQPPPSEERTVLNPAPGSAAFPGSGAFQPPGSVAPDSVAPGPDGRPTASAASGVALSRGLGSMAPGGAEALEAPPGTRIGRDYEVVRTLGKGGMGIVYLARDLGMKRQVALKVLPVTAGTQESAVKRFERERDAIAALDHPGIRPIHGFGRDDAQRVFWLAMGFVDGKPYDALVKEVGLGKESPRRAARVVADAARALAYAHGRGVIHRDIKPGNLMLEGAKTHVVDFGLARIEGGEDLTVEGQVMGTLRFMPPEQALGAEASALSDVYSLGATLFWALTGEGPYDVERIENLQWRVARSEPARAPRDLRPDVPADLDAIAQKALEVEPTERYAGAKALADDLERFLEGEPVLARPPGAWRKLRRATRGKGVLVGGAGLALLSLIGALAYATLERRTAAAAVAEIDEAWGPASHAPELVAALTRYRALPVDWRTAPVRERIDAAIGSTDALLVADVAGHRRALEEAVRGWAGRPDAPPATAAAEARTCADALEGAETSAAATREELAALVDRVQAMLADGVELEVPDVAMDLTLVVPGEAAPRRLVAGVKETLPPWGTVRGRGERLLDSARLYDPADLLRGFPTPQRVADMSNLWRGMILVQAPGHAPFCIDRAEVSKNAWDDVVHPAEGDVPVLVTFDEARAWVRERRPPRRFPTPDEWAITAGLSPWREPAPSRDWLFDAPRVVTHALDESPCGAWCVPTNVPEWTASGEAYGGWHAESGFSFAPERRARAGVRCAADAPGGGGP